MIAGRNETGEVREAMHFLASTSAGVITACNNAFTRSLGISETELIGTEVWQHLAEADGAALREQLAVRRRLPNEWFALTFTSATREAVVLSCWMDVQPTHFTIVAEASPRPESGYDDQLHSTNNELSVLAREHARRGKELAAATARLQETLDELNRTHWHLRKVAEVLSMCARVRQSTTGRWRLGHSRRLPARELAVPKPRRLSRMCCRNAGRAGNDPVDKLKKCTPQTQLAIS
jgi:PAS domain-containing protein